MPKITDWRASEAESKQLDFVFERVQKMRQKRDKLENDWNQADKQYQMFRDARPKEDWRSNLKLPMTFSIVETALSEMIDQSPGWRYLPREDGDIYNADKLEKITQYTWEKGNGGVELISFMKDALIYGTSIGEEYYRQDQVFKKEMADFDLEKFKPTDWKKTRETGYDDCYFESIPIWDFYIDPRATSFDNAMDCLKKVRTSKDDFLFRYRRYPNAKKVVSGGATELYVSKWFDPTEVFGEDEVECWHYYNRQKDLYLVIANGILLTPPDNPNPYKHKDFPFIRGVDVILPHSFYGMGEPKVVECLDDELNTLRNMRLDTAHLNINTSFIVDDRLEMDDSDFVSRPHGVYRGPVGSIAPVPNKPINSEAYKEEELLKDDFIRATGIDPRLQSLGGKGDTATEVSILKEASLKRVRMKLRLLEKIALHRLARLRISNIKQFYSIPRVTRIIGANGEPQEIQQFKSYGYNDEQTGMYKTEQTLPEDLTGEYDIIVVPGSTLPISKAMEAQKSVNLFDRLKGHPDVNQRKLAEDLIRVHDKEPKDLMTAPGEPPLGVGQSQQMPLPGTPGQQKGFNQQTLKAENVMPQKIMGNTPNLNQ